MNPLSASGPVEPLALVADELQTLDRCIQAALVSSVPLVQQICRYFLSMPGKRLRPAILLLAAKALGLDDPRRFDLAAIVELIHTATLLHDDVVDESQLRRGHPTANQKFGNAASVLVGDFLYSRAFERMVALKLPRVMRILATTTNAIAEGEVMQLANIHNPDLQETDYLATIQSKTAQLFEACTRLACTLAPSDAPLPETVETALATYGQALGIAFQVVDDILDYQGDVLQTGKNVGDDLREGKVTLPLILAMRRANPKDHAWLRCLMKEGGHEEDLSQVIALVNQTQALKASQAVAQQWVNKATAALSALPSNAATQALAQLAEQSLARVC